MFHLQHSSWLIYHILPGSFTSFFMAHLQHSLGIFTKFFMAYSQHSSWLKCKILHGSFTTSFMAYPQDLTCNIDKAIYFCELKANNIVDRLYLDLLTM